MMKATTQLDMVIMKMGLNPGCDMVGHQLGIAVFYANEKAQRLGQLLGVGFVYHQCPSLIDFNIAISYGSTHGITPHHQKGYPTQHLGTLLVPSRPYKIFEVKKIIDNLEEGRMKSMTPWSRTVSNSLVASLKI